jgi:uncharacterized protein (DUF302 family)
MKYGYKKELDIDFADAVEKVKLELEKEGFGVLTEINVKDTFKKKLGKDFDEYVILGACSPAHAYEVLMAERDMGLMLPCNIVVYVDDGKLYAAAILPTVAMGIVENDDLKSVAEEVETKLKKVINNIN